MNTYRELWPLYPSSSTPTTRDEAVGCGASDNRGPLLVRRKGVALALTRLAYRWCENTAVQP